MSKRFRFHLAWLCLLLTQCAPDRVAGGAGAGNPPLADVTLAFKAGSAGDTVLRKASTGVVRNPDGTFTVRDSGGAALILTAITVQVEKIDFELPTGISCAQATGVACDSDEVSIKGAFAMDLIVGSSVPPVSRFRLPEGVYRKVGLGLVEQESESSHGSEGGDTGSAAAPNMIIRGHTDSAAGPVRSFSLQLNLSEGLDFDNPSGLKIKADSLNSVVLQLAVDHWFAGVELARCLDSASVPDTTGVLVLKGDGTCGGSVLRIRRNIEASGDLGDDDMERKP